MKRINIMILILLMIISLSACKPENNDNKREDNPAIGNGDITDLIQEQPDGVLATVNGIDIKEEDLNNLMPVLEYIYQKTPEDDDWDDFKTYAVQYVASSKLYDLMLVEYGLSIDENKLNENLETVKNATGNVDDFYKEIEEYDVTEAQVKEFLKEEQAYTLLYNYASSELSVSDNEIEDYFNENKSGFENVTTRDFYQVLYSTKEEADKALEEINNGKSFSDLVKDKKLENDGYVATISKDELIAPFNDIIWNLKENEVYNEVVDTDLGYHIVMANNFVLNKTYTLEEVSDTIKEYVLNTKKDTAMQELISKGTQKYQVTVY